jgi:hypothetical protein
MRCKYMILLALIFCMAELFPAKLVMIGFKDTDPKTEFITAAFSAFLRSNLEEAGFELFDDKADGLSYELMKRGNFFLASKEYFDQYENIDLDNSINGSIKYRGKTFTLNIEVYSREKRKLVMKAEIKGNTNALLAFFYQVTKEIIQSMDVKHEVKNIFPLEDEGYFYKYISLKYRTEKLFESDDAQKFHELSDELESMQNKFEEFPVFSELYDEVMAYSEDFEASGPFDKPFANVSLKTSKNDNDIEAWARDLIVNGYILDFDKIIRTSVPDKPALANLTVKFDIKLKKSYRNTLLKEIKGRKASMSFTDMGRYFFSGIEKDSKIFRDFLLRKKIILRFYDSADKIVAEEDIYISGKDYNGGAFRNAKILPFPLTPRGPANAAFGLKNSSKASFLFEEIKVSDIDRIVRTEIEINFD